LPEAITNTIVVLIGFAGTGKYTIGRELADRMGAKLIHNHLINNSLFTAINADGVTPLPPGIWSKITKIRHVVYEVIRELSPPDLNFIFTVQLVESDPLDAQAFADLVELAAARKSLLVPIRLVCDVDELCRRVVNPSRVPMLKQISAESTRQTVATKALLNPQHQNLKTIDVTNMSAGESATAIFQAIRAIRQ
jgi:shikimate kinase